MALARRAPFLLALLFFILIVVFLSATSETRHQGSSSKHAKRAPVPKKAAFLDRERRFDFSGVSSQDARPKQESNSLDAMEEELRNENDGDAGADAEDFSANEPEFEQSKNAVRVGALKSHHDDAFIPEDGDENGDGVLDARDTELAWRKRFKRRKLGPMNFAEVVLDENDPLVACCPKDAPADAVCLCAGAKAGQIQYTANSKEVNIDDAKPTPNAVEEEDETMDRAGTKAAKVGSDGMEELSEEEINEIEQDSLDLVDEQRLQKEQDWLEKCRAKATKKLLDDRYQLIAQRQTFLDNGTKEEDIPTKLQRKTMERAAAREREQMQEEINMCLVGFRELQLTKDTVAFGSASEREKEELLAKQKRQEARMVQDELRMKHNIAALRKAQNRHVEEEMERAEKARLARLDAMKRNDRWVEVEKGRWIFRNENRPQLPWEQGNVFETSRCSRALIKWGDSGTKSASLAGSWSGCKGSASVLPKTVKTGQQQGAPRGR